MAKEPAAQAKWSSGDVVGVSKRRSINAVTLRQARLQPKVPAKRPHHVRLAQAQKVVCPRGSRRGSSPKPKLVSITHVGFMAPDARPINALVAMNVAGPMVPRVVAMIHVASAKSLPHPQDVTYGHRLTPRLQSKAVARASC